MGSRRIPQCFLTLAFAICSVAPAFAQMQYLCSDLLKAGLFDTTDVERNETVFASQKRAYCNSVKINNATKIKMPVNDMPVAGDTKNNYAKESCDVSDATNASNVALRVAIRKASPLLVDAFNKCVKEIPEGLRLTVQYSGQDSRAFTYRLNFKSNKTNQDFDTNNLTFSKNIECDPPALPSKLERGLSIARNCRRKDDEPATITATDDTLFAGPEYASIEIPRINGDLGPLEEMGAATQNFKFDASGQCAYSIQTKTSYEFPGDRIEADTILKVDQITESTLVHVVSDKISLQMQAQYYPRLDALRGGELSTGYKSIVYRQCKKPKT